MAFNLEVIKTLFNQLYSKILTLSVPYSVLINVCGQKIFKQRTLLVLALFGPLSRGLFYIKAVQLSQN